MIIRQLRLQNFGTYGGNVVFDLAPLYDGLENRPITVIRGKNGVGKSTIMQAIRLCLHGSLAIGPRVGKAEYRAYLASRIHRAPKNMFQPDQAEVELLLDYVNMGKKSTYRICRGWRKAGKQVIETLTILEDEEPIQRLPAPQRESFLRELVSPSAADVFFFDTERLHLLAEDTTSSRLFSETTRTLLGLDLVARLQRDLNVYLARQQPSNGRSTGVPQPEELALAIEAKSQEIVALEQDQAADRQHLLNIQEAITVQELSIAGEGNTSAKDRNKLQSKVEYLNSEIERQRTLIQELCSGLVPFAVSPRYVRKVVKRLADEQEQQHADAARTLLKGQLARLTKDFKQARLWREVGIDLDKGRKQRLFSRIKASLEDMLPQGMRQPAPPILHASDQTRHALLDWIGQAEDAVPRRLCGAVRKLRSLEAALKTAQDELFAIPDKGSLRPLLSRLGELHGEAKLLQQNEKGRTERLRQLEHEKQTLETRLRAAWQKIRETDNENRRVQLAARTQLALEEYAGLLLREKVNTLGRLVVEHFNTLCYKGSFLERVEIDPVTFEMRLLRGGVPFDRGELSAGEKQLLATSALWALRETSALPIPVIVDTPVGRLDTAHRLSMLEEYFPHVSHQVVLLATDAELDNEALQVLNPHVARQYDLCHDVDSGETVVSVLRKPGPEIAEVNTL